MPANPTMTHVPTPIASAGPQDLTPGFNGVKVRLVQQRLGTFTTGDQVSMDSRTVAAVRAFQEQNDLPATGVVDEATWHALGLDTGETPWPWDLDTHVLPARVGPDASERERIDAMIACALELQGSPYTWGGAGPATLGLDCSGLTLMAFCAAGIDPYLSPEQHAAADWLSTHHFYTDERLTHVPFAQLRRGDWVFYTDADEVIRHIALNLGDGVMIHAGSSGVMLAPLAAHLPPGRFIAPKALRPI